MFKGLMSFALLGQAGPTPAESALWVIAIIAFIVLMIATLVFIASRYKRCPSNHVLVVYGKVGLGMTSKCIHGGGVLVWPLIQDCAFLSLTPMTIGIPLQKALSMQNIRINVPSTFTVGISIEPGIMNNAAVRLLNLQAGAIDEMAREIIFGQLRLTVASLTIEQINQDREKFLEAIRRNVEPELNKIGLCLINVNVTDITDESGYIESIGKKAASEAVNRARVDVADQEKFGAIGQANANRERAIRVAENEAEAVKGQKRAEAGRRVFVEGQEADAITGENLAKIRIANVNADLAVQQATAYQLGEVAKRDALVEIQKAQYRAETERLTADEIVREEIEKRKVEISADAVGERFRREAKGQADAIILKYEAEGRGMRQLLEGKAVGYDALVKSCAGDTSAAATLLMIEKIERIVAHQVEAIKNLKIDKITVWDGASKDGSSTANFLSSLIKSLPPLHDVAAMAGVELPSYLGKTSEAAKPDGTQKK